MKLTNRMQQESMKATVFFETKTDNFGTILAGNINTQGFQQRIDDLKLKRAVRSKTTADTLLKLAHHLSGHGGIAAGSHHHVAQSGVYSLQHFCRLYFTDSRGDWLVGGAFLGGMADFSLKEFVS